MLKYIARARSIDLILQRASMDPKIKTAGVKMPSQMIQEMKRINALTLEPALPLNYYDRYDGEVSKPNATGKPSDGVVADLKAEFQKDLQKIKGWAAQTDEGGRSSAEHHELAEAPAEHDELANQR
jgi:hypothetical protein